MTVQSFLKNKSFLRYGLYFSGALVLAVMLLSLSCCGSVTKQEGTKVTLPHSKEGVEEFVAALIAEEYEEYQGDLPDVLPEEIYKKEKCYNETPPAVAEQSDVRIFSFASHGGAYIVLDREIFPLGDDVWGAQLFDINGDGRQELVVCTCAGSGFHGGTVKFFDLEEKKFIESAAIGNFTAHVTVMPTTSDGQAILEVYALDWVVHEAKQGRDLLLKEKLGRIEIEEGKAVFEEESATELSAWR